MSDPVFHARAFQAFQLLSFFFAGAFVERGNLGAAAMNLGVAVLLMMVEINIRSRTPNNRY